MAAQRTTCLCDGVLIGIESIYTRVEGKQINIQEKLNDLRAKSRADKLKCPCGCGATLVLVAGDANLREQHFRLKSDSNSSQNCTAINESRESIRAKIVLKCWLDQELSTDDIESRVPISTVDTTASRRYEFTFFSRNRHTALSYLHDRSYASDEKMDVLDKNSIGTRVIYVTGQYHATNGQFPEYLMKIQERQEYVLSIQAAAEYQEAELKASVFVKNLNGIWVEITLAAGPITDFTITKNIDVAYKYKKISDIKKDAITAFIVEEKEIKRRSEEEIKRAEEERQAQAEKRAEEERRQREAIENQRREEQARIEAELLREMEEIKAKLSQNSHQKEPLRDKSGRRWLKCNFCGLIGNEKDFIIYGGTSGCCYACQDKQPDPVIIPRKKAQTDNNKCPRCGGTLYERSGKHGKFIGCGNYPRCPFTRSK